METDANAPNVNAKSADRLFRRLESALPGLLDELKDAHAHMDTHEDAQKILGGLAAAVISQEVTVMAIEDRRMVAGDSSEIFKDRLIADWNALYRHYARTKYEAVFNNGVKQLAKLTQDETRQVVHEIRLAVEPFVNREMGYQEFSVKFEIPLIGPIKLGRFQWKVKGPRLGIRRIQGRVIHLVVQCCLWLAVSFWGIHWTSWTIFNQPYLTENFEGVGKIAQFFLLSSTILGVWVIFKIVKGRRLEGVKKWLTKALGLGAWLMVAAGWAHWMVWVILGVPSGSVGLEEMEKLALLFFLIFGSLGAWVFGRMFRRG